MASCDPRWKTRLWRHGIPRVCGGSWCKRTSVGTARVTSRTTWSGCLVSAGRMTVLAGDAGAAACIWPGGSAACADIIASSIWPAVGALGCDMPERRGARAAGRRPSSGRCESRKGQRPVGKERHLGFRASFASVALFAEFMAVSCPRSLWLFAASFALAPVHTESRLPLPVFIAAGRADADAHGAAPDADRYHGPAQ